MARNQYRAWSGDHRIWSQVKVAQSVICQECHQPVNTTMELIVDGKCEACVMDEAYQRAVIIDRPFEDHEVFQSAWDAGYEIVPQMDTRFMLHREATGKQRRLWTVQKVSVTPSAISRIG